MATTKTHHEIADGDTLTAAAGDTYWPSSSGTDLTGDFGAVLHAKVTNGATGPTIPASLNLEVSEDATKWFGYGGTLVTGTGSNTVTQWGGVELPPATAYVRLRAGSNTGQDVTLDASISGLSVA